VLAALGVLGAATSAQATPKRHGCPSVRAHLLAADAVAEIYERPESSRNHKLVDPAIVGCAYNTGRVTELGPITAFDREGSVESRDFTLAGTVAALEVNSSNENDASFHVVVANLAKGKILRSVPTGTNTCPKQPIGKLEGVGPVSAIVAKPDGAVAWIADNVCGRTSEVHTVDSSGSSTVAWGADIETDSLATAGNLIYWTQERTPRSAPLD
jgi:hypothetical protein